MDIKSNDNDIPVQPLLDKSDVITVSDHQSAIVLHSSKELVHTYSYSGRTKRVTNITDINALVAEALTTTLTGVRGPHMQTYDTKNTIDLTWTHGSHPFYPFGTFIDSSSGSSNLLSWTARRGTVAARAHAALHKAGAIIRAVNHQVAEVVSALMIISPGPTTDPKATTATTSSTTSTPLGTFKYSKEILNKLPSSLARHLVSIETRSLELSILVSKTKGSFIDQHLDTSLKVLTELENAITIFDQDIVTLEKEYKKLLKKCSVVFDDDPTKKEDRNSDGSSSGSSSKTYTKMRRRLLSGTTGYITVTLIVVTIIFLVVVMYKVQEMVEAKAKKLK